MKLVKKIAALAFAGVFAVSGMEIAYADLNTSLIKELEDGRLTVEEATQKAINYSYKLKEIDENLSSTETKEEDTVFEMNSKSDGYDMVSMISNLRSIRNQIESHKLSAEIEKASIAVSIKDFFASVITAEKDLELFEKKLNSAEKKLKVAEVKAELGLISQNTYDNEVLSYNKQCAQKASKQTAINNAYRSLNSVLGVDESTRYELILDCKYEPLNIASLDYMVDLALSVTSSVISAENSYDIASYKLDYSITTDGYASTDELAAAVAQASRNLSDTKESVKNNVTDTYIQILSDEQSYRNNLKELESMKKEYEVMKIQFEIGKITEIELIEQELSIEELELTIEKSVYQHTTDVERFNNPNLL